MLGLDRRPARRVPELSRAVGQRQGLRERAEHHGDEEPSLFPEVLEIDLRVDHQHPLVSRAPDANKPRAGRWMGAQAVRRQRKICHCSPKPSGSGGKVTGTKGQARTFRSRAEIALPPARPPVWLPC